MMHTLNSPLAIVDEARPYYYTLDRQYNVRGLVDRAGSLLEIYKYDEYGRIRIRESLGRGDQRVDGRFANAEETDFAEVLAGDWWDPRVDMDDDGDVDSTDQTVRNAKKLNWPVFGSNPTVSQATSDFGNPFGWQGRPHYAIDTAPGATDGKLMLIDHRLRMHDPVIGRWLTRDPIGYMGGTFNLYEYLSSNPLRWLDPSGLDDFDNAANDLRNSPKQRIEQIQTDVARLVIAVTDAPINAANSLAETVQHHIEDPLDAVGEDVDGVINHVSDMFLYSVWGVDKNGRELAWYERLGAAEVLILDILTLAEGAAIVKNIMDPNLTPDKPKFPCFPAGTLVILADGSEKPIEQIEIGTEIACDYNPQITELGVASVVETFRRYTSTVVELVVGSEFDNLTLRVTPEHPLYVNECDDFIAAGDVEIGSSLRTLEGRSDLVVLTKTLSYETEDVYNFHVEFAENYFVRVCVDKPAFLVHNASKQGDCFTEITVDGKPVNKVPADTRPAGHPTGVYPGGPYSPGEVDRRRSAWRRFFGLDEDPNSVIPDQGPGRNVKGDHPGKDSGAHDGERNVAGKGGEEHSRVPKGKGGRGCGLDGGR